ncbi:MAG: cytosine deaminase [Methylobacterium sp.]|nr:cytosine deaminase [Methylobacterium sp.]
MPVTLPQSSRYWLRQVSLPLALVQGEGFPSSFAGDAFIRAAMLIADGKIARIVAEATNEKTLAEPVADAGAGESIDCGGKIVLPRFVDVHTHLDKGHIHARAANPDGTFFGALKTVASDREKNWKAEDVRARMDFALRCAFHHGTGAIRTHLDSLGKQSDISWPVFSELREEWKGRIELQASALFPLSAVWEDPADFRNILKNGTKHGGMLGAVTYRGDPLTDQVDKALDEFIDAAQANGLELDFHVDESASPDARSLEKIADAVLRQNYRGRVLAGHCCSLALMEDADRARVIEKLAAAKIAVVSLPMCNLYLQDRISGRTPRWRGVAPLHELDVAGVSTMVASDNTRDPFYAYGDLDGVEVLREATRILHFDHSARPWLSSLTTRPAAQMGLADAGRLAAGLPADFILFSARTLNEWLCRPQTDRLVLIGGKASKTSLPDYAELDRLSA